MRIDEGPTHCYVGFQSCGCPVRSVYDMPHNRIFTAARVKGMILDGLAVQRIVRQDIPQIECVHVIVVRPEVYCRECNGRGWIWVHGVVDASPPRCEVCGGSGRVPDEDWDPIEHRKAQLPRNHPERRNGRGSPR